MMPNTSPPPEVQRFRRSQTPESPRPVHIPEPKNIPVLLNQMDPVFNDTATYNIPNNRPSSPDSESNRAFPDPTAQDHNAVQDFLRSAEAESAQREAANGSAVPESQLMPDPTATNNPPIPSAAQFSSEETAPQSALFGFQTASNGQLSAALSAQPGADNSNILSGGHESLASEAMQVDSQDKPMSNEDVKQNGGGVDYQSLLDTITQSASTAPSAESISAPTTVATTVEQTIQSLPSFPGLPPKPPPQEYAPEFPTYKASDPPHSYQAYANSSLPNAEQPQASLQLSANMSVDPTSAQPITLGASNAIALPPGAGLPPAHAFPLPIDASSLPTSQAPGVPVQGERPWTPKTQSLYDKFLEDERRYVTEGIWDKFPLGSRLFVGNLPSEKVTKRDLFHTFHKHGRLAQISIKQAYGFVQFLEAPSCQDALNAEQGVEIRGRKVHLEISKPQKNTRKEPNNKGNNNSRRRSRSPERTASRPNDRFSGRPPFSDFRDEPGRRRDDYRPGRSPSPRGYRSRDDYRPTVQSPRGYMSGDGRPRSPTYPPFPVSKQGYDEDALLPLPRRDPRSVPDVQLLITDPNVAQSFINWIEQGFQAKGLRASTIWLSARLPLQAVIKRQIIEGVQAVVKLSQANQYNSKIPLQVFDRSAGAANVNWNEYMDLDVSIAADIVVHARQKERGSVQQPPTPTYNVNFTPQSPYGPPLMPHPPPPIPPPTFPQHMPNPYQPPGQQSSMPYPYQQQQPQYTPPIQTPSISNAAAPNLQQLLANLRQPQDMHHSPTNPTPPQNTRPTDLGGLLSNIAARQQSQSQQSYQPGNPPHPNSQPYGAGSQSNVQNIMDQLARYNR